MSNTGSAYFFSVLLTDRLVQSALVSNNVQGIQIKEVSTVRQYSDRKDLLEQLDKSFQDLGPESEDVAEAVFALDRNWLADGEIKDEYKPIMQQITEDLSLEALGQMSIAEGLAEARLIGNEHDSCLLLLFHERELEVIFIKHGQLLEFSSVGRSGDIVADMQEILARLSKHLQQAGAYFPSKILLTSLELTQKELQSLHDDLQVVDWTNNPGFVQAPNIVVLESDYAIKSVSLSAGKVLAKEVFAASRMSVPLTRAESTPTSTSTPAPAPTPSTASSFGIDFDQALLTPAAAAAPLPAAAAELAIAPELTAVQSMSNVSPVKPSVSHTHSPVHQPVKVGKKTWKMLLSSPKKMVIAGVIAGNLGLSLLFVLFALFMSQVTVQVQPASEVLSKSTLLTLDPSVASSDLDRSILKADLESKTIDGQDVTQTTGIALVGDKATGKVVIFNKTDKELELKSGTLIKGDKMDFLLDETVKIDAAVEKSGGSGVDFGKVETTVTAKDIGIEGNINKETRLRVAELGEDKASASTLDNFSGGSSREVRVVSETDQQTLLKNLSATLLAEAGKEFAAGSTNGVYLLPTGDSKVVSSKYSAEVGDETDSLTLELTLETKALKYLASDLRQLAQALLIKDLRDGYTFVDEDPEIMSDVVKTATASATAQLQVQLSAKTIAKLDEQELLSALAGRSQTEAQSILSQDKKVKTHRLFYRPDFLRHFLSSLPSDPARINLELGRLD